MYIISEAKPTAKISNSSPSGSLLLFVFYLQDHGLDCSTCDNEKITTTKSLPSSEIEAAATSPREARAQAEAIGPKH